MLKDNPRMSVFHQVTAIKSGGISFSILLNSIKNRSWEAILGALVYFLNSEFPRTPFQYNEFKHSTYLDVLCIVGVTVMYLLVNSRKARHWPFLKVLIGNVNFYL